MKMLITHINPHLDDISAIWLYKKFHPDFADAEIKFISASTQGATWEDKPVDFDPNTIHFGVGRGKYDEHKGDINECATSLVWKDIKNSNLSTKDQVEIAALEEVVEWNRLIDIAKFPNLPYFGFAVPDFIRPISGKVEDSAEAVRLGEKILDRILIVLINKNKVKKDWQNHKEFDTKWGKAAAISSETANRSIVRDLGGEEFSLFLILRPKVHTAEFFSDKEGIDLTTLYLKMSKLDPKATWYLHHGKKLLICGAKSAPDNKPTKLTFEQLINAAKDN